jgi:thiol-disulfide isomerase/thioredoxin
MSLDFDKMGIINNHNKVSSMRLSLFIFFLTSVISCSSFASTIGEIQIGNYLREVPMHSFSGKIKKFSDFRGKPLIINVWASWCPPCQAELPSLERLARRYGGKQFNVIGISTDDDGNAAAASIKKSGLTFENFLDSNVVLENMLGANTIPLTILVDAQGRVLDKARGSYEWDSAESIDVIAKTFHIKLKH